MRLWTINTFGEFLNNNFFVSSEHQEIKSQKFRLKPFPILFFYFLQLKLEAIQKKI